MLDNVYLAQRVLDKLEAASGVAIGDVPSELAPGQDPNQTAWRLEVQGSAGGQQQGFVDRLRYLDSLKVRGMLLPERAILEGQHGTLAESQSQGDLALLQAELVHHHLTREINRQAVDPVLEANWGPAYRGKVRLEAAPLSDANQGFLRQLVTQVLADPKDFADLFRRADWPAIFDAVGLPQTEASAAAPSGPLQIVSALGQLQREAFEEDEGPTQPPSRREGYSTAGLPAKAVAIQSQGPHNEGDAADALRLHNYNRNQARGPDGKWIHEGDDNAPSAATPAKPKRSKVLPSHADVRPLVVAEGGPGQNAAPGTPSGPTANNAANPPPGESDGQLRRPAADSLIPRHGAASGTPAPSRAAKLLPGEHTWTSADGKFKASAKLVSISDDGATVTLDIKGTKKDVPVSRLSVSDQELVKGLRAVPANVEIDDKGRGTSFNVAVLKDFAKLAAKETGTRILKKLGSPAEPKEDVVRGQKVKLAPYNTEPVTIEPSDDGGNHTKYEPPN